MIQPLRDLIAVIPCPPDEISDGGIIVPDSFKERGCKAKVIAVGKKSFLKSGYTVWHIAGAGKDDYTEIDGQIVYLMPDKEVLGYIKN